jgi:hypothetical protein
MRRFHMLCSTAKCSLAAVAGAGLTLAVVSTGLLSPAPATAQPEGEMPDFAAMMALGSPGEYHKHLNHFVGTWDAETSFIMGPPGTPPTLGKAVAKSEWVLGGRFVRTKVNMEDMAGMGPFEGIGYWGYDNHAGEYVSVWMDSMGTGFTIQKGECTPDHKTFTIEGPTFDPMQGKEVNFRIIARIADSDHWSEDFYMDDGSGQLTHGGTIKYTRRK